MRGIGKSFGAVQALHGVELVVQPGTVHALVGENGAGKSTLMKVLAGVRQPDQGTILLDGRPCAWANPAQALAAGIAMIYQELSLAPALTVAENVFLGIEPSGRWPGTVSRRRMEQDTARLAQQYHLEVDPTALVENLSAGACQVAEILKALARRASVLVMDEPTSSLGQDEAQGLLDIVRTLRQQGTSVVYISHRLEEVVSVADDITVLRDGQTVHSGPAEGWTLPDLVQSMVGRELRHYYPRRGSERGAVRLHVSGLETERIRGCRSRPAPVRS